MAHDITKIRTSAYLLPAACKNPEEEVYIKQETIDNEQVWSVYNTNGEQLAYTPTKEAALLIVMQNDLDALSVH